MVVDELLAAAGLAAAPMPGEVQIQRWRYAKPSVAHPEPCLLAAHLPTLVFAGDAFGGAKVEGAALSGVAAAAADGARCSTTARARAGPSLSEDRSAYLPPKKKSLAVL